MRLVRKSISFIFEGDMEAAGQCVKRKMLWIFRRLNIRKALRTITQCFFILFLFSPAKHFKCNSHTRFKGIGKQCTLCDIFKLSPAVIRLVENLTLLVCGRLKSNGDLFFLVALLKKCCWRTYFYLAVLFRGEAGFSFKRSAKMFRVFISDHIGYFRYGLC